MSHLQHPHPRAYLRHQRRRAIAQRLRVVLRWYPFDGEKPRDCVLADARRYALRSAETPCHCRHFLCASPRRMFGGQTRREDLAVMALLEQLVCLDLQRYFHPTRFRSKLHLRWQLNRLRRELRLEGEVFHECQ